MNVSLILSVTQLLHAAMRSVWILVTVLQMQIVRLEIIEAFAPVDQGTLETHTLKDAGQVRQKSIFVDLRLEIILPIVFYSS